ncbi:hypothetical protein MYU51_002355 [Penicillium brevicompactum]
MSFGFSIGDFLGIIKDIHHIRRVFNGAPAQFKFLNDEVRRLSIIIQDVETYIPNAAQKDKLEQIANECKELIQDIWTVIGKYREIGQSSSIKHAWKRLKLDPEDVRELRDRVCSLVESLTAINVRITQDQVQELVNYKNEEQHQKYLDWLSSESFTADRGKPIYQTGTGRWFIESPEFQTWIQNPGQTLFCPGIPGAVFKDVVQTASKQVFIVIDALDECDPARISRVLSHISETQAFGNLNLLSTSRSVPAIEAKFQGHPFLEIRATKVDVMAYLKARLEDCEDCALVRRPALQEKALLVISDSVKGMFLLAQLYLDSLISAPRAKEIIFELERLMTRSNQTDQGKMAFDNAYQDIVERINNQEPRRQRLAKDTLSWVICARRPLTTLELRTALTIELGQMEMNDEDLYDLEDIISSCAGLITVGSDGRKQVVQLAHYTMQEYFTRHQELFLPEADQTIATACLTYLSYHSFRQGMCLNDTAFEARLSQYPLYSYAAQHWGHHARVHSTIDDLLLCFLNTNKVVDASVQALFALKDDHGFGDYCLMIPFGFTTFYLVAWFGLEKVMQFLIDRRGILCIRDSLKREPLTWAALNGHVSVVKMLLDHGAALLQHDEDGHTPISLAALNGHTEVVELLLDYHVDPNPTDIGIKIPLTEASYRGHHETVKLLLNRGAHPEPKSNYGRTPFQWACYNGTIEIVRILLDHSADIARASGVPSDHCIDINRKNDLGNSAVSYALDHGNHDIIQLLSQKGMFPQQDSHIDGLFSSGSPDSIGGKDTATLPQIGPAIGWPFIETQSVSTSQRKIYMSGGSIAE